MNELSIAVFNVTSSGVNYYLDSHEEEITTEIQVTPNHVTSTIRGISDNTEVMEFHVDKDSEHLTVTLMDTESNEKFSYNFSLEDVAQYPHSTAKDIWLIFYS